MDKSVKTINIRFSDIKKKGETSLYEKIIESASLNRRTKSDWIKCLIRDYFEDKLIYKKEGE